MVRAHTRTAPHENDHSIQSSVASLAGRRGKVFVEAAISARACIVCSNQSACAGTGGCATGGSRQEGECCTVVHACAAHDATGELDGLVRHPRVAIVEHENHLRGRSPGPGSRERRRAAARHATAARKHARRYTACPLTSPSHSALYMPVWPPRRPDGTTLASSPTAAPAPCRRRAQTRVHCLRRAGGSTGWRWRGPGGGPASTKTTCESSRCPARAKPQSAS